MEVKLFSKSKLPYLKVSWLWSYVALNLTYIKYSVAPAADMKTIFIQVLYTDTKDVTKSKYRDT